MIFQEPTNGNFFKVSSSERLKIWGISSWPARVQARRLVNIVEDELKRFLGEIGQWNFPWVSSSNMINNRTVYTISQCLPVTLPYWSKQSVCWNKISSATPVRVDHTMNLSKPLDYTINLWVRRDCYIIIHYMANFPIRCSSNTKEEDMI